jgi:hypothetical protein
MKHIMRRKAAGAGTILVLAFLLVFASQDATARPAAQPEGQATAEASGILAPASTLISYQGTLTDLTGVPVSATATMQFALYDAASGGAAKWGPETQGVTVMNGLFNVLLGSVTPINPANLTGDLWLDITVNGEQLTPRERLTTVPYAVEAGTLAAGARIQGELVLNGLLNQITPDGTISGLQLKRTDEANRTHKWILYHMNQEYGMNSFAIWEYRTDSAGQECGGNPTDGAICAPRLVIRQGGDISTSGNLEVTGSAGIGGDVWSNGSVHAAASVSAGMDLGVGGNLLVSGGSFFGGATYNEGTINLQSAAVPLTFRESDTSGAGSLWRMPLDGGTLRFDASQNGIDFPGPEGVGYKKVLQLHATGGVTCGAITEAGLQTAEEFEAGGTDRFEEGDVLCWGIDRLELCATSNDRLVQAVADAGGRPIVIGAEAVKVLGPVKRGDILVASSVPGHAMVNNEPKSGSVIAQALVDFDGERGVIKAMIRKW